MNEIESIVINLNGYREVIANVNRINRLLKEEKDTFAKEYLENLSNSYDKILKKAEEENEDKTQINYFKKEEKSFIKNLKKI